MVLIRAIFKTVALLVYLVVGYFVYSDLASGPMFCGFPYYIVKDVDPEEQEDLIAMRDNFYRLVLEHQFQNMD